MIHIDGLRLAGLYLFLKQRETETDAEMKKLAAELEECLYDRLSIDDMENIERLYRDGCETLENRLKEKAV